MDKLSHTAAVNAGRLKKTVTIAEILEAAGFLDLEIPMNDPDFERPPRAMRNGEDMESFLGITDAKQKRTYGDKVLAYLKADIDPDLLPVSDNPGIPMVSLRHLQEMSDAHDAAKATYRTYRAQYPIGDEWRALPEEIRQRAEELDTSIPKDYRHEVETWHAYAQRVIPLLVAERAGIDVKEMKKKLQGEMGVACIMPDTRPVLAELDKKILGALDRLLGKQTVVLE